MPQRNVAVIVGSLRKDSFTRMMSRALVSLSPSSLTLSEIEIGDLPHYNQDLETANPPSSYTAFRSRIISCDAVLFITPEYNRSIPGVLKNAVDVGSRPWGRSAWNGKPAAVISITPGALGAMAGHHHLRQILYAVNLATMAYPEAYIPAAATLFDDGGGLKSAETREFMTQFMKSFESWIDQLERR